jgi:hypothetical protein
MDTSVNDARVVLVGKIDAKQAGHKDLFEVNLTLIEYPRYAW